MSRRVLIVSDPDDELALAVASRARVAGHEVAHLDHASAARLFSIRVDERGTAVEPTDPIFIRPATANSVLQGDEAFLQNEAFATLWAAVALTSASVVGRPSRWGLWGGASPSALVTEVRGGLASTRREVFCSNPDRAAGWPGDWAAVSLRGGVYDWPDPGPTAGPFRARPYDPDEAYEAVFVVKHQAWRRSLEPLTGLLLEARSVELCRRLRLDFACVWWGVRSDFGQAVPARVVTAPSLREIGPIWPEVSQAILDELS